MALVAHHITREEEYGKNYLGNAYTWDCFCNHLKEVFPDDFIYYEYDEIIIPTETILKYTGSLPDDEPNDLFKGYTNKEVKNLFNKYIDESPDKDQLHFRIF